MDIKNAPLIVSRKSIVSKVWTEEGRSKIKTALAESVLTAEEKKELENLLPTADELNWMKFYKSDSPELIRHIKKMSVCFDVEVIEATDKKLKFLYGEFTVEIKFPEKVYDIFVALDESDLLGFEAFIKSQNISIDEKTISNPEGLPLDLLMVLKKVINKFFFMI